MCKNHIHTWLRRLPSPRRATIFMQTHTHTHILTYRHAYTHTHKGASTFCVTVCRGALGLRLRMCPNHGWRATSALIYIYGGKSSSTEWGVFVCVCTCVFYVCMYVCMYICAHEHLMCLNRGHRVMCVVICIHGRKPPCTECGMSVCVFARAVCVYVFVYVYAHYSHVHDIKMRVYTCLGKYIHTYTYIHTYIYVYVCVCMFLCVYVCMYVYIYIYIYMHTYKYTHTHIGRYAQVLRVIEARIKKNFMTIVKNSVRLAPLLSDRRKQVLSCTCTCMNAYMHASCRHKEMRPYIHTYVCTYVHTYILDIHTQTHALWC
jgi:hypothetical protein